MSEFGVKKRIATFGLGKVWACERWAYSGNVLLAENLIIPNKIPREFLRPMEIYLNRTYCEEYSADKLVNKRLGPSEVINDKHCHLFIGDDDLVHAMIFDNKQVIHLSWRTQRAIPANFIRGKEMVEANLLDYLINLPT